MGLYSAIKTRYQYLIGENDTSPDTIGESHINAAIKDICNAFNFSWNVTSTSITTSSYQANLPTDFNNKWGLDFVTDSDENVWTRIPVRDQYNYSASDKVYWITFDNATNRFVFNTLEDVTVTIYYYFNPTDLANDADVCIVPDTEAVAYLAAAKYWLGDDQDSQMKQVYEQEASARIQQLYTQDLQFGPQYLEGSIIELNSDLTGG